jgi:hypothetical protein
MNKCRSCNADFKGNYFCKSCSKEVRSILKGVKDLSDHKCPGHGPLGGKHIRIEGKYYGFVPTRAFLDKYIDFGCVLCAQEAKKEFDLRRIHAIKEKKNLEINSESLVKKCCRVIARDPGLLLAATNVDVPEHLWKEIYHSIPNPNDGKFKKIMNESEKGEEWKYAAIGSVFKRFKK